MTIESWLQIANKALQNESIQSSYLDAIILLEHVLNKDRAWILAHTEENISTLQQDKLKNVLIKRLTHVPIAYIIGKSEFYGRTFHITSSVLQPRPETETFIPLLLKALEDPYIHQALPPKPVIADVGTGSGALGTTIALECHKCLVELLEIDENAAKVAKTNVDLFTLDIPVVIGDLLANANPKIDIIVANLPYIPDEYTINTAALHEPRIAIFGGQDGLDVYRRLFKQAAERTYKPLLILIEALPPQHPEVTKFALKNGYSLVETNDFIQLYKLKPSNIYS